MLQSLLKMVRKTPDFTLDQAQLVGLVSELIFVLPFVARTLPDSGMLPPRSHDWLYVFLSLAVSVVKRSFPLPLAPYPVVVGSYQPFVLGQNILIIDTWVSSLLSH